MDLSIAEPQSGLGAEPAMSDSATPARRPIGPIALIVSLFFLWGMANNLNEPLI